jgi:hypothetical protein
MDEEGNQLVEYLPDNSLEATLARMLESSTLTSGLIALLLISTVMYCVVTGIEIPDVLTYSVSTIIGFFFGSKTSDQMKRASVAAERVIREVDCGTK